MNRLATRLRRLESRAEIGGELEAFTHRTFYEVPGGEHELAHWWVILTRGGSYVDIIFSKADETPEDFSERLNQICEIKHGHKANYDASRLREECTI